MVLAMPDHRNVNVHSAAGDVDGNSGEHEGLKVHLNIVSFLLITIFSSAARYSNGKMKRQLKLPSPVKER